MGALVRGKIQNMSKPLMTKTEVLAQIATDLSRQAWSAYDAWAKSSLAYWWEHHGYLIYRRR